ncbi:MAG: benzoate-CoA ligase family protein [Pseudomonadota bacterium]
MTEARHYNAAEDLLDRNVAAGLGDKTAFIDMQTSVTYGELLANAQRVGNLLADAGIEREQRVAMLVLDTVDFPAVFLGAIRSGVIPIALNTLLTTDQYAYILQDCGARAVFVSAPLLSVVEPVLAGLENLKSVFVLGGDGHGHTDFHAALRSASPERNAADTVRDEVAFWLYSSGSTGMPKGVPHIHSSMMDTATLYAQPVLNITGDDVCYSAAKLFFAYGLGNGLTFPMSVGATAVLLDGRPTPDAVMERIRTHQATLFFGVPTLYAALLADPNCTPENSSPRLRHCVSAGEALPADIGERWVERFGVDILDGVGSTELLHIFCTNRPGDVRYGRSGRAVPGYDIRLVDDDGNDVAQGEVGEMLVRCSTAAVGYWNQRERSRRTFVGEWTRTGDKYILDANGYYEICGRTDDMFKVSGIWVSPFEVEAALISHPAVLEAGVVPADEGDGLLKPKAFVVLKEGAGSDDLYEELKDHVKDKVGVWKYPRWVEFVDDLPKTATGKIQRFKLRAEA